MTKRIRSIDFLRGLAVMLVMCRHYKVSALLYQIGYIGVDLFFVLSGFLIGGLIFQEYKKAKDVKIGRFLIRRAFKIYPAFYILIGITLLYSHFTGNTYINGGVNKKHIIGELLFIQNYYGGIWYQTWSLAVEEHFYIFLAILVFIFSRNRMLDRPLFAGLMISIMILTLLARFYLAQFGKIDVTHTHLHMDSLFSGVLLAYLYHFRYDSLKSFYHKFSIPVFILIPCLLTIPFIFIGGRYEMNTFGVTCLYLCFSLILLVLLFQPQFQSRVKSNVLRVFIALFTMTGVYSYSIYLWHMFVKQIINIWYPWEPPYMFPVYFMGSILLGSILSILIEYPFLRLRDYLFPKTERPEIASRPLLIVSEDSDPAEPAKS